MLMSATGGIEGIEGLLGRFLPPLKVPESHRPANGSAASLNAASGASAPGGAAKPETGPKNY